MADGSDTPTDGGASSAEGQSEAVVGGFVPRLSLTGSGASIVPVYAGSGTAFHFYTQQRGFHFRGGIYAGKPSPPRPIAYGSSYVPQHRGYTGVVRVQKRLEGLGEPVRDPMANFKEQKFEEAKSPSQQLSNEEEAAIKREYKNAGRRAYKSENRGNRETPSRRKID